MTSETKGAAGASSRRAMEFTGLRRLFFARPRSFSVFIWILLLVLFETTSSEYTLLLDSGEAELGKDLKDNGWVFHPDSNGWWLVEGSVVQRDYPTISVCSVSQTNPRNWVRLPYITIPNVNTLYVNVSFTMRRCVEHHGDVKNCLTRFSVMKHEVERESTLVGQPPWNDFVQETTINGNLLFNSAGEPAALNNETGIVTKTKSSIYLAFLDEGTCAAIARVQVFYKTCPAQVKHYVSLPRTPVGENDVQVEGRCVDNAVQLSKTLAGACFPTTMWFETNPPTCQCKAGYEGIGGTECIACAQGMYKSMDGHSSCKRCPFNSDSRQEGQATCRCNAGYYRAANENSDQNCTTIPSVPRHIIIEPSPGSSESTIKLTWTKPESLGGRTDITYSVECTGCLAGVEFFPRQQGLTVTGCTISNLAPGIVYNFTVYSENGVTGAANGMRHGVSKVVSEVKSKVFKLVMVTNDTISLQWDDVKGATKYRVKWSSNDTYSREDETDEPKITLTNLKGLTNYRIQYQSFVRGVWMQYSSAESHQTRPQPTMTQPSNGEEPENTLLVVMVAVIAVLVCMTIVIIIVVMFLRRASQPVGENIPSSLKSKIFGFFNYSQTEPERSFSSANSPYQDGPLSTQLLSGIGKTYIDPHTYEDPQKAVREFAKEIDKSIVIIEYVIGGGEFGNVCRGRLNTLDGPVTVAIKTLKSGASEKNRLDFLTEASIMGQFEDPNVIHLEGVVTKATPIMIVTEYMDNGSLDTFLRNNDGNLKMEQLVTMMKGIASGMRYLSRMNYIHRDLAARNILVDASLICKVADFGLSRVVESDTSEGAYTTRGGKIPVRWTSPEAIAYRKFTSASDVWSFGVVMWEVISYGERPYWNWSNQEVIKAVDKDYRLPPPMDCPQIIYQLMLDCWQKERGQRPKFDALVIALDKMLQSHNVLEIMAKPRNMCDDLEFLSPHHFPTVAEWLAALGMEDYTTCFQQHGCTTVELATQLSQGDLIQMGIRAVGHQKRIMDSIHCATGVTQRDTMPSRSLVTSPTTRPLSLGPMSPSATAMPSPGVTTPKSPFSPPVSEGFLV